METIPIKSCISFQRLLTPDKELKNYRFAVNKLSDWDGTIQHFVLSTLGDCLLCVDTDSATIRRVWTNPNLK